MAYKTVLISVADRVAVLTINRPEKLNALNAECKAELLDVLKDLRHNPGVDVVIVTGAGEKAFVAGTDIDELTKLDRKSGEEFSSSGQALFDLIENLGKPVIAAVNGYALGGGCELALACHIRLASEKAKFGQPEVNLGIIPGYGGTQRLARIIGKGRAMEMILSGVAIDAPEAHRIGLANVVVPASELLPAAQRIARLIATKGQVAVRLALSAIQATDELPLPEGQRLEAQLFGECCASEDFQEGTRAFLSKRPPEFKNR